MLAILNAQIDAAREAYIAAILRVNATVALSPDEDSAEIAEASAAAHEASRKYWALIDERWAILSA